MMGKGGLLGEASCFVLAGLALIPLAEVSLFVEFANALHVFIY